MQNAKFESATLDFGIVCVRSGIKYITSVHIDGFAASWLEPRATRNPKVNLTLRSVCLPRLELRGAAKFTRQLAMAGRRELYRTFATLHLGERWGE